MHAIQALRFYVSTAHPCSYLPGQQASTLFVDPQHAVDAEQYAYLSELGFRRSGRHIYRPHCKSCQACIPLRVPVERFRPSRQQRRILQRNQDLDVRWVPLRWQDEHYALYARYIEQRHRDGDMYPPSPEQFRGFLLEDSGFSQLIEFRLTGRLLAVALCDQLENGLSAVYTFFDPDENARSLGRFAVLWQIQEAQQLGLPAVYLGYWIEGCRKMSYKCEYRPFELYLEQHWHCFDERYTPPEQDAVHGI